MAYTSITFEHPKTNAIREAPVGFSWTVLFFGPFPAMFRGDWKYFGIMFLAAILSFGFSGLVFMFIYNRMSIQDLVSTGYLVRETVYPDLDELSRKLKIDLRRPGDAAPRPESTPEAEPAPEPAQPRPTSGVPKIDGRE